MNCKLKIAFVLPGTGTIPVGGVKVVYEYANHLARKGHQITVVHPARGSSRDASLLDYLKTGIRCLQFSLRKDFRPDSWFQLDPTVKLVWVPNLSSRWISKGDAVIATAWRTAEWVSDYPADRGRRYYLIQHLETWDGSEERVYATWKAPLKKIVIAKWLLDIAKGLGEEAVYIPNGLSADEFQIDIPPDQRDPRRIMMLYHHADWKGSADGIGALLRVREIDPEIKVTLFGVPSRPASLPQWFEYHQQPERSVLRALYNQAAIFLAPSWTEGWPLPPAEAMMCGAAVIATDIGGHREYCLADQTAVLTPPKDPNAMAENLVAVLRDQGRRIRLASAGNEYIQQFTWSRAAGAFEATLIPTSQQRVASTG